MNACNNPAVLEAMQIIIKVIDIIKVLAPVLVVITGIISFTKAFLSNDQDAYKSASVTLIEKFIIAAFIFFVPTVVGAVMSMLDGGDGYLDCFNNATPEKIQSLYVAIAEEKVKAAEVSNSYNDYRRAKSSLAKIENQNTVANLSKRLEVVKENIDKDIERQLEEERKRAEKEYKEFIENNPDVPEGEPLNASGSVSSGNGACQKGVYQDSEPDPSAPLNCWPSIVNVNNFIFPRDEKTGKPLGAWPKDYSSIPTQLTEYKEYQGGFIWPTTPVNGIYHFVYQHNGMDIMAVFGTPVYSPVDGSLDYSEWGHTSNRGGDETSYSISITMLEPVTFAGKKLNKVFLTHMSGIRYRCTPGSCKRTIHKGELIGFTGNAAGDSASVGWAPHLHATYYPGEYDQGLITDDMDKLYNIPARTDSYAIKAGG